MKKWYLIHTKANQERIAKLNLENQSVETYLPTLVTIDQEKKKIIKKDAMFPRYIFSKLDINSRDYSFIRSTKGVSYIVKFGDKYGVVPDSFISKLKSRSDYDENFVKELKIEPYALGDSVLISHGLLKGKKGVFLKKSSDRAKILLDILQKNITVELLLRDLETKLTVDDFKL